MADNEDVEKRLKEAREVFDQQRARLNRAPKLNQEELSLMENRARTEWRTLSTKEQEDTAFALGEELAMCMADNFTAVGLMADASACLIECRTAFQEIQKDASKATEIATRMIERFQGPALDPSKTGGEVPNNVTSFPVKGNKTLN